MVNNGITLKYKQFGKLQLVTDIRLLNLFWR